MTFRIAAIAAALALAGVSPAVAQQDDPGGMMAAQGCMMLAEVGSAELTVAGESLDGVSLYQPGPNGEAFLVVGELDGADPVWCLSILTAVPVADATLDVASPETVLQTEDGALVVMATLPDGDEEGSFFTATSGSVTFGSNETLDGRIDVEGSLETGSGTREIAITGTFSATPMQ